MSCIFLPINKVGERLSEKLLLNLLIIISAVDNWLTNRLQQSFVVLNEEKRQKERHNSQRMAKMWP